MKLIVKPRLRNGLGPTHSFLEFHPVIDDPFGFAE